MERTPKRNARSQLHLVTDGLTLFSRIKMELMLAVTLGQRWGPLSSRHGVRESRRWDLYLPQDALGIVSGLLSMKGTLSAYLTRNGGVPEPYLKCA